MYTINMKINHKTIKFCSSLLLLGVATPLTTITSCNKLPTGDLVCLGDSLTDLSNYGYYVASTLKLNGYANYGICGSSISNKGPAPFIYRYQNMYKSPKIVIVDGGYNDYQYECPLGNETDTDGNTFYGALNILIPGLQDIYSNKAWVFFMTPFYYSDRANQMEPYIDAIVNRCDFYHMDCFNIFDPSFPFDYKTDTYDNIHVKHSYTVNTWAPKVCEYIETHYPDRNI